MRDEVSHLCHTALQKLARPAGLEPATPGYKEDRCAVQVSYRRVDRSWNVVRPTSLNRLHVHTSPSSLLKKDRQHYGVSQDLSTMAVEPPPGWCPAEGSNELPSCVLSLYRRDHTWRARKVPYALAGRDETGYEAAVPDRTASHEAPAASSFLYLISARG